MSLPAIARQLDRCGVCGKKTHKKDLVRTQVRYKRPEGENHFSYSYYDGSFWTTNATSSGNISSGPEGDKERASVSLDNTVTSVFGSATFTGNNKLFRSTTGVDVSDWTSLIFSAEVGPHFDTQAEMTIALGYCDTDGNNQTTLKTWTAKSGRQVWATVNISSIAGVSTSAVCFFINITGLDATDKYYIDWLQLEKNRSTVGPYFRTSGTAYSTRVYEAKLMTAPKVCQSCRETLLKESEQYGRPRTEVELPVPMDAQEV